MSISNLMVNQVARINVIEKTKRSRRQSQNSFAKLLKQSGKNGSTDSLEFSNALTEKNPHTGGLGNA